jgi:hypothetical protein
MGGREGATPGSNGAFDDLVEPGVLRNEWVNPLTSRTD